MEITPQQLATINLRFGSAAKPLKVMAFADLTSKGLFFIGRPAKLGFLAQEIAKIIGVRAVDAKLIESALKALQKDNKVIPEGEKWKLTDDMKKEIEQELKQSESELDVVLKNHFPQSINPETLKSWFMCASADFFQFHSTEWVKSVCKKVKGAFSRSLTIPELLDKSIRKYNLKNHKDALVAGFGAFLVSDDHDDQKHLMKLGFAMFSAQLVAADIGSDPITINELKDSTFILDTNILYAINLESHWMTKSIKALDRALGQINAKLHYLHPTKEEYERVHNGIKGNMMSLLGQYSPEVVLGADDDFAKTAKSRQCKTKDDLERFFDEIKKLPEKMNANMAISMLDYKEIEELIKKAEVDASLKALIQKHYIKLRSANDEHREKSEAQLKHDASIVRIVESLRNTDKKTWILTLDRSLQASMIERAGNNDAPISIYLGGLVQILAVHSGGPNQDASDFAPLLSNIIMKRCAPQEKTYRFVDLQWLHQIQERAADFAPDRVIKIAEIVKTHRLSGMDIDDSRLGLAVNRAYQEEKREYARELDDAKTRAVGAESEAKMFKDKLADTQKDLSGYKHDKCVSDAGKKLKVALWWRIPIAIAISVGIYILAKAALPVASTGWLEWGASVLAFVILVCSMLWNPIKKYKEAKNTCSVEHTIK